MKRSSLLSIIGIGLGLMLLISYPVRAVDIDVACDTADLITAINTANGNGEADTINLAAGCTYSFSTGDATNADSALPRITSPITINGNGATLSRIASPIFRLLYVTSTGDLTLDDVTVTGGTATGGGGIWNEGATTVTNSTLTGNSADFGGGVLTNSGTTTVTSSTISGNSASDFGGGGFNAGGTLTVTGSTISGNDAANGGGFRNDGGTLTVTNSTIFGNSASDGGGVLNNGALTVTNSTFSGNSAAYGGGIYNYTGALEVTNSTLSGNSATSRGGGIYNYTGALEVTNSTLSGNSATYGGGIFIDSGALTVTNSTLSGNSATYGGGILNNTGTLTVTNTTLSGNSASGSGSGGGIYNHGGSLTVTSSTLSGNSAGSGGGIFNANGALTAINSIVWGNSSQIHVFSGTVTVTFSDVQGGISETGNIDADPLFVDPIAFGAAPTTAGDYRLQSTSPAINTGSNAALPADTLDLDGDGNTAEPIPYDLDGNARVVNGVVDMGAYEHQVAANIILSKTAAAAAEGGATDTYTIVLASKPSADVTIDITSSGQAIGSPSPLTFTPTNWSVEQTVTVTAVDDAVAEGAHDDTMSHSVDSSDAVYSGISVGSVSVTITDNETAGVLIDPIVVTLSEDGMVDTYTVMLTSEPTVDVTITPTGDAQCTVSAALTFTSADWDTPQTVTVTAVDDAVAEGDHGCTVTNTSASGDPGYDGMTVASIDATIADNDPFTFELLTNSDMETDADLNNVPDGWTLANKTGDKLLCDPAKAHSGNCAFKFKGGVPETAQLSQVVDLTGLTFAAGDTLSLSAWFKGVSTAAKTKFVLSVTYAGNPIPVKTKLTVKQNAGYTLRSVADYALTAGTVDQIKVTFQHKSAAGTVYVDDASLIHTPIGGRRSDGVLPPPAAPQGFRGGN